jgi:hypothetical protein
MSFYDRWVATRWQTMLVFVTIALLYQLISERLTLGYGKYVLVAVLAALVGINVAALRGHRRFVRASSVGVAVLLTTVVVTTTAFLLLQSTVLKHEPVNLLRDAAVLWISNVLTFALWYWEIDGGGPDGRAATGYRSSDFAFPQGSGGQPSDSAWAPGMVDYVFLAFTIAMAFSPTDTSVLTRRAKLLVMAQSLISMLCVAVLAARAINML